MGKRAFVRFTVIAMLAVGVAATPGVASDYPSKPVRVIVPYPAGSGTDIVGRLIAQKLSERLGQPFFVDNKPGAAGTIGTGQVAKADPDGYTLLVADVGPLAIAPTFFGKIPYDPTKELAPIGQIANLPFILVVHPSLPVHTVPELIALAKSKPGKINYATPGNGTAAHLATEFFKQVAGVDMVQVPYRGSAPALTDLIAGVTSLMFVNVLSVQSFLEAGQLRALAIGGSRRSPAVPNVPTVAEYNMNFSAGVWFGLLAPAGTPPSIIKKLNSELNAVLAMDDVTKPLAQQGTEVVSGTPEEFSALIRSEIGKWANVIHTAGIRAQ